MLRRMMIICFLMLLVSCQPVQTHDSSYIKTEDVVKVLEENDIWLTEGEITKGSVFGSKLQKVEPHFYLHMDSPFYIYEFGSSSDREKGQKEFYENIAEMDVVGFSMFENRNILILYVHQLDPERVMDDCIHESLDRLMEG